MASEAWHRLKVSDLAAPTKNSLVGGPFGSNLVSADYVASGVPVIRGQNMGFGRWVAGEFVFVTPAKAEELRANIAVPGDLVFTQRGTLGQVALVPEGPFDGYVISQSQMKLTIDRSKTDELFVYYFFSSDEQKEYIRANAIQTGVPHTNLGILRETPVLVPPLRDQRAIAQVLGALDDKIELNRRMNQTLEDIARATFRSWFVDREPVAIAPARRQPCPGTWRRGSLLEVVEVLGGGTPRTSVPEYWDGEVPWFSVADAPVESDVFVTETERSITMLGLESSSTRLLPRGATILTARGTVGKLALVGAPMAMNQSCYGLLGRGGYGVAFVYYSLRFLVSDLQRKAHGSVFDTITRDTLAKSEIDIPPVEVASEFEALVAPALDRILCHLRENKTLAALRDTLLPKLLSGEIRVKQAERVVGEAV